VSPALAAKRGNAADFAGVWDLTVSKTETRWQMTLKVKGTKVKNDPGFAEWMLRTDFPANTLLMLRKEMDTIWPPTPPPTEAPETPQLFVEPTFTEDEVPF